MLPSARRRQQETAAREAAGESLWTTTFDSRANVRIAAAWSAFGEAAYEDYGPRLSAVIANHLRQEGGWQIANDVQASVFTKDLNHDLRLDMLATIPLALDFVAGRGNYGEQFMGEVNAIMREHRIAYKFVEGELIPFESDELLQNVVEPTLRLMVGERFKASHDAYLKALKEIAADDPGDAITDAATALQQTLVALGCKGNALGPLMKDAKNRGLLGAHDQPLIDGIGKFIDWVNSDRTATGDAHDHSTAVLADAWLVVHVVGALIVRLADPARRGAAD